MTLNLQQTAIDPANEPDPQNKAAINAMLADTQGNILSSHGRNHSHHIFIEFSADTKVIKQWLAMMAAKYVTSAHQQMLDSQKFSSTGVAAGLFVNLCLSASGYRKLGGGITLPADASFRSGAKQAANKLNDPPPNQWEPGFQGEIDALIILADDEKDHAAGSPLATVLQSLEGVAKVVDQETGAAMRLDNAGKISTDKSARVHEHFGFADGVSQPLFFAKDIDQARRNSGGFDQWDPSAPLGLVLAKDPNGGEAGYGSYMVYRKLEQNVAGFRGDEAKLAKALFGDKPTDEQQKLAAAYIVGRFRDGTPVGEQAVDGWINEPNNFNYRHDVDGLKCPFQAHARKANPRGDKEQQFGVPLSQERTRRIARRAISYGPLTLDPPADEKVGLLFLCAQSDIAYQFEFMQAIWCNFDEFLRPNTGLDTVVGQAPGDQPTVAQKWPKVYGLDNQLDISQGSPPPAIVSQFVEYKMSEWVTMRGGEYLFLPSISFLSAGAS
jgi:Dyp-type peroxidase family